MVSFRAPLVTLLPSLLPAAHAYITGFTAPASAAAGAPFNATLSTALYSQQWRDFAIVWGLVASPAADCDTCVGTEIGYTTLTGGEGLSFPYTFTDEVTIPAGTAAGEYILKAAIPWLIGVS